MLGALRSYLTAHQYGAATSADLAEALAPALGATKHVSCTARHAE
jgi:hypothetical protein